MDPTTDNGAIVAGAVSSLDLLDHLAECVYFTDSKRQILYWNRAAERLTGYRRDDVVGSHCWDNILMHVDAEGRSLCRGHCPLMRAMQTGEPTTTPAFLRHRDGHRIPVTIRTVPLRDRQGAIVGAVETFRDDSPRLEVEERMRTLERQAKTDPLSGLSNRRHMEDVLAARIEELRRFGWPFGVIFLDIDFLKRINDEHGHPAGDEAIRLVARTLRHNVRVFDVPARWGGEEFAVVCENITPDALRSMAERLRTLVEASEVRSGNQVIRITLSAGVTLAVPGDTADGIIARADRLLYESKRAGRNRVTFG